MKRLAAAALVLAMTACASPRGARGVPPGDGPLIGVYRASLDDGSGPVRKFKLLLWAERPDRLHAELLAPVGGVSLVLDAGGGSACLVDVGEATAYAGRAGPAVIESLAGVPMSVEDAVAAILSGSQARGLRVERTGGADGELPDRLLVSDGSRSLALARVKFQRGAAAAALGTGSPPQRMIVRPIEDLPARPAKGPDPTGASR